mmetsp:Transcript_85872/g.243563  ORF Transcript_85872/g.243563 Transcript_85872/m.243563 type:complete len:218 (+) Transcript_85872:260-913(+)
MAFTRQVGAIARNTRISAACPFLSRRSTFLISQYPISSEQRWPLPGAWRPARAPRPARGGAAPSPLGGCSSRSPSRAPSSPCPRAARAAASPATTGRGLGPLNVLRSARSPRGGSSDPLFSGCALCARSPVSARSPPGAPAARSVSLHSHFSLHRVRVRAPLTSSRPRGGPGPAVSQAGAAQPVPDRATRRVSGRLSRGRSWRPARAGTRASSPSAR